MKKWILIGGAVVIVVVGLLVVGVSNLGPIVKNAVNTYGPKLTKTAVRVGDVSVSIFSGEAKLKDLHLGNPSGFKTPEAVRVASVFVDVDEGSLTGDTVVIDKIEVIRPDITYEKARGVDNFQAILTNVNQAVGAKGTSGKQSKKAGGGKKLLIRNFIVTGGKVNLAMSVLGDKTITAALPDVHLKGIGQKNNGASPAEAFKEIFAALYQKITSPGVAQSLNQGLKALGSGVGSVSESVQKAGEGAKKQMDTAGEDAKKQVGAVTDKLKGMFGK